ncbi:MULTISPECIES: transposase [unclassified Methylobacterium]|uniref:transposase n=2 Tax=unclassified Methylobacterium TaxID=2615210 RepID=UPI00244EA08B|nr:MULTISPECIES: transposase [unclassified Methylobacterium]
MRIKVGNEGLVQNKTVYIAIGVRVDGSEETHGLWLEQDQRRQLLAAGHEELRSRGFEDVLLAIVDGLRTLPTRSWQCSPGKLVQICNVHLLRDRLDLVFYKDCKVVVGSSRTSTALIAVFGEAPLSVFEAASGADATRPSPRAGRGPGAR